MKIDNNSLFELTGVKRIDWAARSMPVLQSISDRFEKEKPLDKVNISACLHVTTETANLMIALKNGGANIALCASNPLSTQNDVVAALNNKYSIPTFAKYGATQKEYYESLERTLETNPTITMDDGADLVSLLHTKFKNKLNHIVGGTEETTTGVIRLRSLQKEGKLLYPIIAVNDADTKHMFDNRYGTGQSTIDGITRATNILWAGKKVVVFGYGWCGRGIAMRAKGMGARVMICEVDPIRALEAVMDGFEIDSRLSAAKYGDVFITATGNKHVMDAEFLRNVKSGAILANSGHFNVEIDLDFLKSICDRVKDISENIKAFYCGELVYYVLCEGRLVNLAAAEGHPSEVMDMSFANQALCVEYLITNSRKFDNVKLNAEVYSVPKNIDRLVAKLKLEGMHLTIDSLNDEQIAYLNSWNEGT